MADEPVRIEFQTNAEQTAAAIESINVALLKIPSSGQSAGQGIDSFVSRSTAALGRLSAEINRVSGELRSLGTVAPGMTPTAPAAVAPVAAAVPPVQQQQQEQVAQQASQYAVREYSYQKDPSRGYMRPVYGQETTTSSLEEAQQLQKKIQQQPGSYAQIYEQPTQQIQNTNAALRELSETQTKVSQTPITTPQNVAALQAETQGVQAKTSALNESLTTQRQAAQAAPAKTTGADQYIADYKRQQEELVATKEKVSTPPAVNTAPIKEETAAYQQDAAAIRDRNAAMKETPVTATGGAVPPPEIPPQYRFGKNLSRKWTEPLGTPTEEPVVTPPPVTKPTAGTWEDYEARRAQELAEVRARDAQRTAAKAAQTGQPQPSTADVVASMGTGSVRTLGDDAGKASAGIKQMSDDAKNAESVLKGYGGSASEASRALGGIGWSNERINSAFKELGVSGGSSAQTFKELSTEAKEAQNAFDGSKQSLDAYTTTQSKLGGMKTEMNLAAGKPDPQFEAAAAAANKSERALAAFAEAEFKGARRGADLASQLAIVRDRLAEVGQADPKRPMLEGLERQLQGKITKQEYREEDQSIRLLQAQAKATKDYEPVLSALSSAKQKAGTDTARLTQLQIKEQQVLNEAARAANNAGSAYGNLGNLVSRQAERIAVGLIIWTTMRTAQEEIQKTIAAMQQYSVEVARFAAITAQSIGSATQQYNALRDAAVERGFTPSVAAPAITTTARFTKAPEAQQQLMDAGTRLAEFIGAKDPSKVIEKLGESVIATGGDFSTAAAKAEMLAAAFIKSGSSAEQFLDTLSDAAAVSDKLGMSYDKTVALIVSGATASGQTASVSFQALNRISETFDKMGGEKLSRTVSGFRELGVNVLDSSMKLRDTGDIIEEVGQKFGTWDKSKQDQAITLLFGGETVKGNIRAAGAGLVKAYFQGMVDEFAAGDNILESQLAKIEDTFGKRADRIKARAEAMRGEGDTAGAFRAEAEFGVGTFLGSTFLGKRGGEAASRISDLSSLVQTQGATAASQQYKENFVKSLAGLSKEEAAAQIDEFNNFVNTYWNMNAYNFAGAMKMGGVEKALISDADKQKIVADMQGIGQAAGKSFADAFRSSAGVIKDAVSQLTGGTAASKAYSAFQELQNKGKGAGGLGQLTPTEEIRSQLNAPGADVGRAAEEFFPTNAIDLTKYSMQEINQMKQISLMLAQQELEAIRAQAMALGLSTEKIDEIVEARRKELQMTVALIKTQGGLKYEMGLNVARLSEGQGAVNQRRQASQQAESNFVFQRHKDIDPGQFGQLQALTAMYDAMLTKMGSPEKSKNINLLLGEENVFKTMTGRLTALQMAMEDLTKVEKAQLSGTWNMPSGATALVPISSLDVQRWNKGEGGGGMSPEALMAMLEQMGLAAKAAEAEGGGGGGWYDVAEAERQGTSEIVAAIKGQKEQGESVQAQTKSAMSFKDSVMTEVARTLGIVKAPTPQTPFTTDPARLKTTEQALQTIGVPPTRVSTPIDRSALPLQQTPAQTAIAQGVNSALSPLMSLFGQKQAVQDPLAGGMGTFVQMLSQNIARNSMVGGRGMVGGGGGAAQPMTQAVQRVQAPPVNVNVSMLPIKAALTANLSVVMDGRVIARALAPLMYDMLARAARGQSVQPRGVLR